jgi:hypothetical protein
MSTAKDRLYEVYLPYKSALARRPIDLAQAGDTEQVQQVLKNIDTLHAHYFRAARLELEATGDDVEDALREAKAASEHATAAYEASLGIAERIRRVSHVVAKVGALIEKATS